MHEFVKISYYIKFQILNIDTLNTTNDNMRENNISDIIKRLTTIFYSSRYKNNLTNPKVNWLDVSIDVAIEVVMNYVEELDRITIL